MKYLLFMYQLGVSILKDTKFDTIKEKNMIHNFDTFNLTEELNDHNIKEIYEIFNVHDRHELLKTLESKDYIYETKISLLKSLIQESYQNNNQYKDLFDDWNFEF